LNDLNMRRVGQLVVLSCDRSNRDKIVVADCAGNTVRTA
jgi:hypothetical protein